MGWSRRGEAANCPLEASRPREHRVKVMPSFSGTIPVHTVRPAGPGLPSRSSPRFESPSTSHSRSLTLESLCTSTHTHCARQTPSLAIPSRPWSHAVSNRCGVTDHDHLHRSQSHDSSLSRREAATADDVGTIKLLFENPEPERARRTPDRM